MKLPSAGALKPYPGMKDSGVDWLGEVPEHWTIRRVKYLLKECDTRSVDGSEELLRVSQYTGVTLRSPAGDGDEPDTRAASLVGYKRVEPDDLVVNIMLAWNGSMGVSPLRGITSPAYCVYRLRTNAHPWYFHHLFRSPTYKARIKSVSTGVVESRLRLYTDDLYRLEALVPPLPEQTAIVRFLDHADRRIRRYIRAKQKLIALLEEQKQAIIHQAVTGQIDVRTGEPYPSYRVSGVEWLGDVPGHWEVAALHHRYSQCLGKMLDSKRLTGTHSVPYLRNVDVQWDQINTKDLPSMDIPPDEYERYTVQEDDLLVCEGGEIGRCALWSGEVAICGFQKALHRLRPRNARQDVPRFMHYALRAAAKGNAFNDGHLSTIAHLTGEKLRGHRFPFAPVAEQESLVRFLDGVLNQADYSVCRVRRQIDVLNEYRTRLMADVVTGKLDVREAAPGLPEADVPSDTDELAEE